MNLIDEIYNKVANFTSSEGKRPTHLILSRDYWARLSIDAYPTVMINEINFPEFFGMIISVTPSEKKQFIEVK
jgi:hypothetical protein